MLYWKNSLVNGVSIELPIEWLKTMLIWSITCFKPDFSHGRNLRSSLRWNSCCQLAEQSSKVPSVKLQSSPFARYQTHVFLSSPLYSNFLFRKPSVLSLFLHMETELVKSWSSLMIHFLTLKQRSLQFPFRVLPNAGLGEGVQPVPWTSKSSGATVSQ